MPNITIDIAEEHLTHLTAVAKRHGITPELLAASIVQHRIEGEDTRREIHRLRVDLAIVAQVLVLRTGMRDSHEAAWEWAKKELLQEPWP